jgi:mono/diheme cytochrome c family protein
VRADTVETIAGGTYSRRPMRPRLALVLLGVTLLSGCSESSKDPVVDRGRQVYLAQCTQCHAVDPSQPGPVGPPVKGSSRELLEARIVRGAYPPGYTPKRPTTVMPPQPAVAPDIPALAAYLK